MMTSSLVQPIEFKWMEGGHRLIRGGVEREMNLGIESLVVATLLAGGVAGMAQQSDKQITEAEIKAAIVGQYSDECNPDQIHIAHLEYYDFAKDGRMEAVVVAATCMTGTAGPDVHAVYKRDTGDKVVEIPIVDQKLTGAHQYPIFGNSNYDLAVEGGALVARWVDGSGRDAPMVIRYRYDGHRFVAKSVEVQGPFPTSYDCAKATREMDRVICYSPAVAALDVQLGQAYRDALQRSPVEKQQTLRDEQRVWLAEREKQCTIYKWWVDCLTDMYTKRIADLKQSASKKSER